MVGTACAIVWAARGGDDGRAHLRDTGEATGPSGCLPANPALAPVSRKWAHLTEKGETRDTMTNEHAAELGKLGRARNTEAQREASRRNGRKGGRPPEYQCLCGASGGAIGRHRTKDGWRYKCRSCGRKGPLEELRTVRA